MSVAGQPVKYALFLLLLCFIALPPLSADVEDLFFAMKADNTYSFPENYTLREKYRGALGGGPFALKNVRKGIYELPGADYRVKVAVEEQNKAVYLLFINELDYSFPLYSKGTYIIKTDELNGEIIQIKVFLKSEKGCFLRIFPEGGRSRIDLYLYGYPLYRHVLIPKNIEALAVLPFSDLVASTNRVIDWNIVFPGPDGAAYGNVISMINAIRDALPSLPDMEDGAMDESGKFVFIETGEPAEPGGFNCSGFAKWVVDGLYYPLFGRNIKVDELKIKNRSERGNRWSERYESSRDPYFGLDWTRNLAVQLEKARFGVTPFSDFSDVRDVAFFSYTDDVGYKAENLPVIMYLLAVKEPGYFYLASVNDQSGKAPNLRQHFHVAAIFPYVTSDGDFAAPVFERNFESSLKSFANRYPKGFIHLVRIPALRDFSPPIVE